MLTVLDEVLCTHVDEAAALLRLEKVSIGSSANLIMDLSNSSGVKRGSALTLCKPGLQSSKTVVPPPADYKYPVRAPITWWLPLPPFSPLDCSTVQLLFLF